MDKQTVLVGNVMTHSDGQVEDLTHPVEFIGEELGRWTWANEHTNTRGRTETLYRREDGHLVVHTKRWDEWVTEYSLKEISRDDLLIGQAFEALGREAGISIWI
jgi:hypothetical protein